MIPEVTLHTAVSLDGRIEVFEPAVGLFYRLAATFREDATLGGSETVLRSGTPPDASDAAPPPPGDAKLPLLVVPDSRGRVRCWAGLLAAGFWRAGLALVTPSTPAAHRAYLERMRVEAIVTGGERVDLRAALEFLAARHDVRRVRVDSGGTLNGALLREGLVSAVSVLVHPVLVGGTSAKSMYRAPDLDTPEGLIALDAPRVEVVDGGVVWLRYAVKRP